MSAKRKYPWDKWLRQDKFRVTRGIEFQGEPHGMAQQVRNAAARRKLKVSIRIKHSTLDVTVRHEFIQRSNITAPYWYLCPTHIQPQWQDEKQ